MHAIILKKNDDQCAFADIFLHACSRMFLNIAFAFAVDSSKADRPEPIAELIECLFMSLMAFNPRMYSI